MCVVDGLSDFLVGGYTHQPITDDLFNEASFTQCSQENMHTAQAGIDLQVTCDVLVTTEVIMIVSTSAIPVRLCLAEVKAYAYGQYSYWCNNNAAYNALLI